MQNVANIAQELSSAISEISMQTGRANESVSKASQVAENTQQGVNGLSQAAGKIGEVLQGRGGFHPSSNRAFFGNAKRRQ